MKYYILITTILSIALQSAIASDLTEKYKKNETLTYVEVISHYTRLAETYETAKLFEYGNTDAGLPLQLFVISPDGIFNPDSIKASGKVTILINNAIHAGEPCGVDASAKFAEDILESDNIVLTDVVICIIPAYNIGGMLNRSCCSRANQNGPIEYGTRANAINLDLNRDFIKSDAKNTKQFYRIFHDWKPEFFVGTHSTNGADYPAVMTLITSARSRLEEQFRFFFTNQVTFNLYNRMFGYNVPMSPYYNLFADSISQGLKEFLDTPRYSTGFTNLFNTLGFVTEAHMLKPFPTRVDATYDFLLSLVSYTQRYASIVLQTVKLVENSPMPKQYGINYVLDTNANLQVQFESYKRKDRISKVTDLPIHYYDKMDRDTSKIPYYADYEPTKLIDIPEYYIVPQQWGEVIERLNMNRIEYETFDSDTSILVEVYYIDDYRTVERPYEGHYLHYDVNVRKDTQEINFHKGDIAINTKQKYYKYLIETLEPEANDSFFVWNFFDAILQQKEWFSDYLFEPKAEKILSENPDLKQRFEEKKKEDKEFAQSSWDMLYYIYKNSKYYEKSHNRYPIYRIPSSD